MKPLSDEKIIRSWAKNADSWIGAIKNNEIESRVAVTNKAICNAIMEREPKTVLDIGCGEGWLVRELGAHEVEVLGVDVIPALINYAKQSGKGRFMTLSYEELSFEAIREKFDVIVCNFSLLGEESVNHIFSQVPSLLEEGGAFIVQTIHPDVGCIDEYEDGWRAGSWDGFNEEFIDPAPWYFRTMASWRVLFKGNGMNVCIEYEPMSQQDNVASVVFVAEVSKSL